MRREAIRPSAVQSAQLLMPSLPVDVPASQRSVVGFCDFDCAFDLDLCLDMDTDMDSDMEVDVEVMQPTRRRPVLTDIPPFIIRPMIAVPTFRDRVNDWLDELQDCIGYKVLLSFILMLLMTMVVLAFFWPFYPHYMVNKKCSSPDCLRIAATVVENMNKTVNPCENPWEWACGSWISAKNHEIAPAKDREQERKREEYLKLRGIITTMKHTGETDTIHWKLNALYQSCMNEEAIEIDGIYPLKKVIENLGGWKSLRILPMRNWNFVKTLIQIYTQYGGSPFFKISVEMDPMQGDTNIIRLKPIEFEMPIYYYTNASSSDPVVIAYKIMLQDIFIFLGGTSIDGMRLSEDIYGYERRIAYITSNDVHTSDQYTVMTVSDLRESARAIPIEDILRNYFPKSITQKTRIWVPSKTYFRDISGIISTTDDRIMNDYLITSVVRGLTPFMGSKFVFSSNVFKNYLNAVSYEVPRWEFCTSILHRFTPLAVAAILQNYGDVPSSNLDKRIAKIEDIFNSIRDSLINEFVKESSISKKSKEFLEHKISYVSILVGLPKRIVNLVYANEYYGGLKIQYHDFFKNVLNWFEYLNDRSQISLMGQFIYDDGVAMSAIIEQRVIYNDFHNIVAVPHYLADLPHYHIDMPIAIQFGRLGVMISEVIAEMLMKSPEGFRFLLEFLNLERNTDIDSKSIYANILPSECYNKTVIGSNGTIDSKTLNLTLLNTIKHLSGVKLATNGLNYYLKYYQIEHQHTPGLNVYEDEGIFLLAYIQNMCTLMNINMKYRYIQNENMFPPQTLLQLYPIHVNYYEGYWCRSSMPGDCN